MDRRLEGRVVVLTGGCGDIGRATAAACTREGAAVVVADVLAPDTAREALGSDAADYLVCDVSDPEAVRTAIASVERRHGRIDVAIANAGITRSTPALDVSLEEWR